MDVLALPGVDFNKHGRRKRLTHSNICLTYDTGFLAVESFIASTSTSMDGARSQHTLVFFAILGIDLCLWAFLLRRQPRLQQAWTARAFNTVCFYDTFGYVF